MQAMSGCNFRAFHSTVVLPGTGEVKHMATFLVMEAIYLNCKCFLFYCAGINTVFYPVPLRVKTQINGSGQPHAAPF